MGEHVYMCSIWEAAVINKQTVVECAMNIRKRWYDTNRRVILYNIQLLLLENQTMTSLQFKYEDNLLATKVWKEHRL